MFSVRSGFREWDISMGDPKVGHYGHILRAIDLDNLTNTLYEGTPIFQFIKTNVIARDSTGKHVPITYNIVTHDKRVGLLYNDDLMEQNWYGNISMGGGTDYQYEFQHESQIAHNLLRFMNSGTIDYFKPAQAAFKKILAGNQNRRSDGKVFYNGGPINPMQTSCYYQQAGVDHPTGVFIFPSGQTPQGTGINLPVVDDPDFKAIAVFLGCVQADSLPNITSGASAFAIKARSTPNCIPFTRHVVSDEFPNICLGSDMNTEIVAITVPFMEYIFNFYNDIYNISRTFLSLKRPAQGSTDHNMSTSKGVILLVRSTVAISHLSISYTIRLLHGSFSNSTQIIEENDEDKIPDPHLLSTHVLIKHFKLLFCPTRDELSPTVWYKKIKEM